MRGCNASRNTRGKTLGLLAEPQCTVEPLKFGVNSVVYQSILNWNELQLHYKDFDLCGITHTRTK